MSAPLVQARYESLDEIATRFARRAEVIAQVRQRMAYQTRNLVSNSWKGKGATEFAGEMEREVLPALQRLVKALADGGKSTQRIAAILREAEAEAEKLFKKSAVDSIVAVLTTVNDIRSTLSKAMTRSKAANKVLKHSKKLAAAHKEYIKPVVAKLTALMTAIKAQLPKASKAAGPQSKYLKLLGKGTKGIQGALKKYAIPIALFMDAMSIRSAYVEDGNQIGINTKRAIGGVAGGWGGAFAGAKAGAVLGGMIGSIFPGVGTVVGAGVGGFLGGIAGAIGGEWIGERIGENIGEPSTLKPIGVGGGGRGAW